MSIESQGKLGKSQGKVREKSGKSQGIQCQKFGRHPAVCVCVSETGSHFSNFSLS